MDVSNWKAKYKAVYDVLGSVPKTWEPVDFGKFGSLQEKTAQLLIEGGLVEIRRSARIVLPGHPTTFVSTYMATGVHGPAMALKSVLGELVREWGEPIHEWINGGMSKSPPFQVVLTDTPDEWRLSDQGEIALDEFDSDYSAVLSYVLREGVLVFRNDCAGYGSASVIRDEHGSDLDADPSPSEPAFLEAFKKMLDEQTETIVEKIGHGANPPKPLHRFIDKGATYEICFEGRELSLEKMAGFAPIKILLSNPGQAISIEVLSGGVFVSGEGGGNAEENRLIMREIAVLQEKIQTEEDLEQREETEKALRFRQEQQKKITRPGGVRSGGQRENARTLVTKNIGKAIDRIRKADRGMGDHLESHIETVTGKGKKYSGGLNWATS